MTDGADIVDRLKRGNLDVSGSASSINALLRLHREAAGEIERLRTAAEAPLMDGTEKRLRDYADNPAASGMVPVNPATLREVADEIEALRRYEITHKNNSDHWRGRAEYAEQLLRKRDSRIANDAEYICKLEKLHEERDAIMREADKRVEARIAETDAMIGVLNWCRDKLGSVALNDELEERLVGLGIDIPRDGGING